MDYGYAAGGNKTLLLHNQGGTAPAATRCRSNDHGEVFPFVLDVRVAAQDARQFAPAIVSPLEGSLTARNPPKCIASFLANGSNPFKCSLM